MELQVKTIFCEKERENKMETRMISTDDFISRYEYLYFEPKSYLKNCESRKYNSIEDYKKRIIELGIENLKGTDFSAENEVVNSLLKCSIFNKYALAWKAGKIDWKNDKLGIKNNFESEDEACYINGYGGKINKDTFKTYCLNLETKKEIINKFVDDNNWKEAYKTVMAISPKNIGPVYNINTLFFLTAGKAPIYDKFAHKAVKALLLDISPSEVYLGGNPIKGDVDKVIALYKEYMILLKLIFTSEINKNGMYISRELDRSLWVYGHSTKKYKIQ